MNEAFLDAEFPLLETPRLILRATRREDAAAIFRIFGDPVVTRYHDAETHTDVRQSSAFIDGMQRRFAGRTGIRWGIARKQDNRVIGTGGFNRWNAPDRYAAISYDLAHDAWGQGIMTEAVSAIIRFGFEQMDLNRIEAETMLDNRASVRVLQKLGFQEEGTLRQRYFWKGQFHDLRMFSLLEREYATKEGS